MKIFNENAYINVANAVKNYRVSMQHSDPLHMESRGVYDGSTVRRLKSVIESSEAAPVNGSFQSILLQSLDKVSGAQQRASALHQEAILNPDLVDAHDITIAQYQASSALNLTRNILNQLVQGWRELINTR